MSVTRLLVYLAGPVRGPHGLWRAEFEAHLVDSGVRCIHPGANIAGAATTEEANGRTDIYVPADLLSIRKADILVAALFEEELGRGTSFELGYATALGREVLLVAGESAKTSWQFAIGAAGPVYSSLREASKAVRYIADQLNGARYDPGLPG